MPCYSPMTGYRARNPNPSGKRSIVFNKHEGFSDLEVTVPCGQCIGCRLEYSRQWAIRCVHETSLYERNCFITLTYDDENLPDDGSLIKEHYQNFMKRLRKRFKGHKMVPREKDGKIYETWPIRYFQCGEYGELTARPHYHAILFNFDFEDKEAWKRSDRGDLIYRSKELEKLWPFGHSSIGEANFETAAYVARYVVKKQKGEGAQEYYEQAGIIPEYVTMSRRPGIANDWLHKWHKDVYPGDFVVLRGMQMKPPKRYDSMYEILNPKQMAKIKGRRKDYAKQPAVENNCTPDRRRVREYIQKEKLKLLTRRVE